MAGQSRRGAEELYGTPRREDGPCGSAPAGRRRSGRHGKAVAAIQSLIATPWNIDITAGAVLGALLPGGPSSAAPIWGAPAILRVALTAATAAPRNGFPVPARRHEAC
ncbi:hypothetical protein [Streptomyces roseolus]|uniref:hypothetical protein n=1 Tax=Streptomyces roseolus TaxID=67358 RepID=UPI00364ABA27